MVHAFILENSYHCKQGDVEMSWIPLVSMQFMMSIFTWNSKILGMYIHQHKKKHYVKHYNILGYCNDLYC